MNKILKIFLAMVLTVLMTVGMIPVNTVHADDEVPVAETTETLEEVEEIVNNEVAEESDVLVDTETEDVFEPVEDQDVDPAEEVQVEDQDVDPAEEVQVEETVLNAEAFYQVYDGEELGGLVVTVSYEAGTVPEGTEVVVAPASLDAVNAVKAEKEENINVVGADISFVFEGEEIEPKDYSDKKVTVTLSYAGEENLTDAEFETVHVKETLNEEGEVVYGVETVEAVMTPVTAIMEVPYEYTWTETVPNYVEVPVYESRDITEERTEMVTKTREVEKTRVVKVKIDILWWDPTTWLGYKYVLETYTVTETYEEEETVTVVVGTEEVLVGYETKQDGTREEERSEIRYREEEVVVGQTVVFEADDFSTFTITWPSGSTSNTTNYRWRSGTYGAYTYGQVTIHYVDQNGNPIPRPTSLGDNTNDTSHTGNNVNYSVNIADTFGLDISGYTYQGAHYNSATGSTVTTIQLYRNNGGTRYIRLNNGNTQVESFTASNGATRNVYLVYSGSTTSNHVTIHHGVMVGGAFVEFGTNGLPNSSNSVYPTNGLDFSNYGTSNDNRFAYLIYDFPGYTYSATYYRTTESSTPEQGGTSIKAVLRKGDNNNWQYRENNSFNANVANDSHVYVIYTAKSISQGANGSGGSGGESGQNSFIPDVGKNVSNQKADGTYDISIGFIGDKQPASYAKARVIVVFDRSGSMDDPLSSTDSTVRLTAAKNSVNAMANKLLTLTDADGHKLVEMGLVSFGTSAQIESFGNNNARFTSDYSTFESKINTFTTSNLMGGTNWEKALDLANSMEAASDAKTYIVFISDGDPTFRTSRGNYMDYDTGSGTSLVRGIAYETLDGNNNPDQYFYSDTVFGYGTNDRDTNNRCYDAAKLVGDSIVGANKTFYIVGLSADVARMSNLANDTGGTFYDGSDSTAFANHMATIAGKIADEVGLTDVTITDGVTDMSQISTESLVGTAEDFEYFKSYPLTQNGDNYTYKIGTTTYTLSQEQVTAGTDGTHRIFSRQTGGVTTLYIEYPWEGAPEAEVNENNAVIWDTSDANNELEHGVYYSVKFTVWPKQEAYDLIADLDNEVRKITDDDLTAGVKAQLRILLNSTTYEYDTASGTWTGGLTDAQLQALIDAGDAIYSMKTNTGLNASYKYGGVNQQSSYTNYVNGNMSLDDTPIKIKKTWNNYLDAREAADVQLTVMRGNTPCVTINMGDPVEKTDAEGHTYWEQTPDHEIYISLGVLSVTGDTIIVRETGYDYTVEEPENFSYRWDLTSDIYHPMVINGTTTVLIKVTDTTDLPTTVTGLADNKTVTAGGNTYYKFGGQLYVAKSGESLLEATNDRRSNLMINKVVEDTTAPEDDLFPIQITITNPNDPLPGATGYDTWYHTLWFFVSTEENNRNTIVLEDLTVSDNVHPEISELRTDNTDITDIVLHEADDDYPYDYITYNYKGSPNVVKAVDLQEHTGTETIEEEGQLVENTYTYYSYYTGFYWFDNGATVTVSIKDGWYINFNNMGRDTVYEIVEPTATMPDGYTFVQATSSAEHAQGETVTPATINGITATGVIDKANSDYRVTYKNNYEGVFYVYHSSNNTVERLPMATEGEAYSSSKKFSIYAKTAENTLYGGYYHAYLGSSITETQGATLTYENNVATDANGTAYSYQYILDSNRGAWTEANAYTTIGTAMVPVRDTVYFLKEVPEGYLQPYTHYTYYKDGLKLSGMITVLGVDDLNYNSAGFYIETANRPVDKVVSNLKIKATNGTVQTTINAAKVYKTKGVLAGYLGYADISTKIKENTEIVIKQYWTTIDGIEVQGTTKRTLSFGNCTINQLTKTDAANN